MLPSSRLFWATLAKVCPTGKQTNEQKMTAILKQMKIEKVKNI